VADQQAKRILPNTLIQTEVGGAMTRAEQKKRFEPECCADLPEYRQTATQTPAAFVNNACAAAAREKAAAEHSPSVARTAAAMLRAANCRPREEQRSKVR
jgi:hypothetical protein